MIGGCKVLRSSDSDVACVIAAGVTLFEALKAYDELQAKGINISVIDLYSVKPLDKTTIIKVAKSSKNRIITVEDHYPQGGIGEAVLHALADENIKVQLLAVNQLPRSGKPEELLHLCGIDAEAIVQAVQHHCIMKLCSFQICSQHTGHLTVLRVASACIFIWLRHDLHIILSRHEEFRIVLCNYNYNFQSIQGIVLPHYLLY